MIALIQRVTHGQVTVKDKVFSQIKKGYVVLLGIFEEDSADDVVKLAEKVANLRVMSDSEDKMNRSILDTKGEILLVSQFTLCADITGGRRPSFIKAMKPESAKKLYELLIGKLEEKNIPIKTGQFGQYMEVQINNDGPVTIIVNSRDL
jgi:D-tyrosyl-tRNA(Tyr) deacylase